MTRDEESGMARARVTLIRARRDFIQKYAAWMLAETFGTGDDAERARETSSRAYTAHQDALHAAADAGVFGDTGSQIDYCALVEVEQRDATDEAVRAALFAGTEHEA